MLLNEIFIKTIKKANDNNGWFENDSEINIYALPKESKELTDAFNEFGKGSYDEIRMGITEEGYVFFWRSTVFHQRVADELFGKNSRWDLRLIFKSGTNFITCEGIDSKQFLKYFKTIPEWKTAFKMISKSFSKIKSVKIGNDSIEINTLTETKQTSKLIIKENNKWSSFQK